MLSLCAYKAPAALMREIVKVGVALALTESAAVVKGELVLPMALLMRDGLPFVGEGVTRKGEGRVAEVVDGDGVDARESTVEVLLPVDTPEVPDGVVVVSNGVGGGVVWPVEVDDVSLAVGVERAAR